MHIYFLGICGTGMGNAALMMRSRGHVVEGADEAVYPPMSDLLREAGVTVHDGFDAGRLAASPPDLAVVGNAMTRGNPEVEWLLAERRVPWDSLPGLLSRTVLENRRTLVFAGTHGKTTTSALAARLLQAAGREPGYFIGGVPRDLPGGAAWGGDGDPFVIEGDEYDSAFFDKRSKFIHYRPHILAVNNIEFDHGDIFRDLEDVHRSFSHLYKLVPANGWILSNADDPECPRAHAAPWTRVVTAGTAETADLRIVDFREDEAGASFRLVWKGSEWAEIRWEHGGLFNARNAAMAALAAGLALYPDNPARLSLEACGTFRGVKRRLEPLAAGGGIEVYEDFAHHPTAVRETLGSLRNRFPGAELWTALEPRSNTMRTRRVQESLAGALSGADRVLLGEVSRKHLLAPGERLDTHGLAETLRAAGTEADAFEKNTDIVDALLRPAPKPGRKRIVLFFTNGSFDGIPGRYAATVEPHRNDPARP